MKAFTLKTVLVSVDKSSKNVDRINKSYNRMTRNITIESKVAGFSFSSFAQTVGMQSKRVLVSMNNMNASVNRAFRKISQSKLALGFGVGLIAVLGAITMANVQLDASLASLQAITGKAGKEFIPFRQEIDRISKSEKLFGGDTAKAFEIVGSAQPILLKSADSLGLVTEAVIKLKKAGLIPIEDSAKAVTGTMNQFELGASQASRVINVLAAGAKEGSANIQEISESMDRVGAVAKSANMSIEQTGAAIELMSKYNLKGSEAGISLKATILRLKAASLGFASGQFNLNDALIEYNTQIGKISDPVKKAAKEQSVFGKEHILTGQVLSQNINELNRLTVAMTGTDEATIQANINNNTFKNRLAEIGSAFKNSITASQDQGKSMQFLKDIMVKIADNMDRIISTILILIGVFVAFKAVVILSNAALVTYNIVMGITGALFGTMTRSIALNAAALTAYKVVTGIATAAQWLLNTAFYGFPLVWIIAGIAGLVAGIILLIKNFDSVIGWIKKVGKVILSFLLAPIEAVLWAINKLSGGVWANDALANIKKIRSELTEKEIKISTGSSVLGDGLGKEQLLMRGMIDNKSTVGSEILTKEDKLTRALDKNSTELEKNTDTAKNEWTGKFRTTILKDANINEKTSRVIQRELATASISNENNIAGEQKDIINNAPQSVVTQIGSTQRNAKPTNGTITINVVDKTGGNFALEVKGTGVNVVTTGNG